jgi:isoamylase
MAGRARAGWSATGGNSWRLLVDTNVPESKAEQVYAVGDSYGVTGRSLLLFVLG